ncbi:uncharacterized, partial [Tachysurus ichikawai]
TSWYQISHPHAVVGCLHNWGSIHNKMLFSTQIILADGFISATSVAKATPQTTPLGSTTPRLLLAVSSLYKPPVSDLNFIHSALRLCEHDEDVAYSFHYFGLSN